MVNYNYSTAKFRFKNLAFPPSVQYWKNPFCGILARATRHVQEFEVMIGCSKLSHNSQQCSQNEHKFDIRNKNLEINLIIFGNKPSINAHCIKAYAQY